MGMAGAVHTVTAYVFRSGGLGAAGALASSFVGRSSGTDAPALSALQAHAHAYLYSLLIQRQRVWGMDSGLQLIEVYGLQPWGRGGHGTNPVSHKTVAVHGHQMPNAVPPDAAYGIVWPPVLRDH
jgi:hypothetical protein